MVGGQPSRLVGLETWDGWLIAGNTHDIFVMQNKLILHGYIHFKTILLFLNRSTHYLNTTKEFLQLLENISSNPLPPSHSKEHVISVCKHKFACTNVTPKQRNGAHFMTRAPYCARLTRESLRNFKNQTKKLRSMLHLWRERWKILLPKKKRFVR